jgi:hypothetical protein
MWRYFVSVSPVRLEKFVFCLTVPNLTSRASDAAARRRTGVRGRGGRDHRAPVRIGREGATGSDIGMTDRMCSNARTVRCAHASSRLTHHPRRAAPAAIRYRLSEGLRPDGRSAEGMRGAFGVAPR